MKTLIPTFWLRLAVAKLAAILVFPVLSKADPGVASLCIAAVASLAGAHLLRTMRVQPRPVRVRVRNHDRR